MLRRINTSVRRSGLIVALVCGAGILCNGQIMPWLIAQTVSTDPDHSVALQATNHGVDLIFSHPTDIGDQDDGSDTAISGSERVHVVHVRVNLASVDRLPWLTTSTLQKLVAQFWTPANSVGQASVPPRAVVYSRPPPGAMSILRLDRSVLAGLLI